MSSNSSLVRSMLAYSSLFMPDPAYLEMSVLSVLSILSVLAVIAVLSVFFVHSVISVLSLLVVPFLLSVLSVYFFFRIFCTFCIVRPCWELRSWAAPPGGVTRPLLF